MKFIHFALFVTLSSAQLWREDYFKDEIMRFTTEECWRGETIPEK